MKTFIKVPNGIFDISNPSQINQVKYFLAELSKTDFEGIEAFEITYIEDEH
jgi:hypothetical protein